jgi:N-acetylneuraminic acid mutarotase
MKKKILGTISFIVFSLFVCAAAYAQGFTWTPANPMNKARAYFVAVELLNGNVLVAGGFDGSMTNFDFPDAEIYDWHTGEWTRIAPMNTARSAPAAVRLEDGRVMVIGGADENFNFLASAEIYDPRTDTWSFTASMNGPRFEDFTAVLLPGRKVLVAGGFGPGFEILNSAEIYDQKTNTWTPTGSMNVARGEFATVVLNDGRVLAVGGVSSVGPLASAEIYDPRTGSWTLTGSMSSGRNDLALVVLRDGRVLAAGGGMGPETAPRWASAEIFDPRTGQWTPTGPMTAPRSEVEYASVLLPDGRVLVPGGYTAPHTPVSSSDLYDPRTGTWTASGSMSVVRAGHSSIVLRGNRGVLVMGGGPVNNADAATASVDIAVPTH